MNISFVASLEKSTYQLKQEVIPLTMESLKEANYIDYSFRKSLISNLRGMRHSEPGENVVMLLSFDPKSCDTPKEYCSGDCNGCDYNPVENLFFPYSSGPLVITGRDTVSLLLDSISLLANANKNALLLEKIIGEKNYYEQSLQLPANRQQAVERTIKTLEEVLIAEEHYYNTLPDHPAFVDTEKNSMHAVSQIEEALDNLRDAYAP